MRVLFGDDEEDIREPDEIALLSNDDIEPVFGASGRDAMTIVASQSFDVIMPPPDGPEVLRAARRNAKRNDMPIITCTARTAPEAEAEVRALGAGQSLQMPFRP